MSLDKTLIIAISTLFLTLGCESPVNSSNPEIASSSTNVQSKKSSNHSQVSDTTTQACVIDNSKSINIYYPQSLKELKINGYSTFKLTSTNEIETSKYRPHEFTRIYQNDRGYTATLMSQNAIRNLELTDAKGQTTSYSFDTGLKCDALPSTNYSTYIVSADKAFIYKQPNLNNKTSSYFIEGDEIEVLSTKDNWIETSYLKGSKKGWLRLDNLKKREDFVSSFNEKTDSEIQNILVETKSDNSISSDQSRYVINKEGIGNISLGQAFQVRCL